MAYSLLLVDSQKIMIEGIRMLLGAHPEITDIHGVHTHAECLAWLEKRAKLPDVLMLDVQLPDTDGLEALLELKELYPDIRIIMLTANDDLKMIKAAMSSGARGYMLKNISKDELMNAVRAVANNFKYIDIEIHEKVIDHILNGTITHGGIDADSGLAKKLGLTKRELEVLQLIVRGKTNQGIAEALFISPNTADTHRKNIMAKCDTHHVVELTNYALKNGLVSL
jgi:two-component system, NarL family, response regulator DegU